MLINFVQFSTFLKHILFNIAQIATFLFEVLFLFLFRNCGFAFLNWELLMIHFHHLNMTLWGGYFMPFNSEFHLLYSFEEHC